MTAPAPASTPKAASAPARAPLDTPTRPPGPVRTLSLARDGFAATWVKDPNRFEDLLLNPFRRGALRGLRVVPPGAPAFPRKEAARVIETTNRAWEGDAASVSGARSLGEEGTLAVVTGQQAGLFAGPLYSLVKAMSAVALAADLARRTGRRVVPVFWVEGDDHDFEEIRTAWVVNREGFPRALRYGSSAERPGIPAFRRRLGRSVRELLRELESTLPATAFTGSLLETVRSAYARGTPFSEAFGRLLLRFTRGTGLVVMDPTVPRLKELALPVFRTALANRAEARRRIARATTVIEAAGFPAQAAPEGYSVFHLGEAGTRKWLEDAGFPDEGAPLLSAAVLLRPLVQDFLLPTAAYVGGPAEIAYHAQIGRLYDLHRIPRPLVVPRHLVTVVPRSRLRVLDRDGIPFDELSRGDESALNRIAADPAAAEAIARARTAIRTRLAEVEEALGNLDGSLRAASRQAAGRMAAILHRLERKSVRAAKRLDSERRQRFLRARNLLFPGGVPQERRLSPLVFWNLYGPDFARWLLAALRDPAASRRRRNLLVR